jgi:hypothetical protein
LREDGVTLSFKDSWKGVLEGIRMTKRKGVWFAFLLITAIVGSCLFAEQFYGADRASSDRAPSRPPIVGVANIGLRFSYSVESKEFCNGKLDFGLAFSLPGSHGDRTNYFKVNDHQYIRVTPDLEPGEDRLRHIELETTDARALRSYLAAYGIQVPPDVDRLPDGGLGFEITDPDGHHMQFAQYVKGFEDVKNSGKFLSPRRSSHHILHAGITVQSQVRADTLYKNVLGFHAFWNVAA